MASIVLSIQVLVSLVILNVWLVRRNRPTPFRGGQSSTMTEEFKTYGLPGWAMAAVGLAKVSLALCLLAGLLVPALVPYASLGLGFFMVGAILMHLKVRDSLLQTAPALIMALLCAFLFLSSQQDLTVLALN